MDKKYLIGVDIGTSNVKAIFLNARTGRIVTRQSAEISFAKAENPDWLEQNAADWWTLTGRILKQGFQEGQIDPAEVAGISFGGWTVMALMVDDRGEPLHQPVHYNDMRHLDEVEELKEKIGAICVARNGNMIGMYNGTAKQLWWKNHRPDLYRRARYFVTEVSWINWKLTGVWSWNRTEAGFFSPYNTYTRQWDQEILDRVGFPASLFPPLYDSWEKVGTVTEAAARETGLAAGTPVFAGADDAAPVAITTGSIENGQCYLSIGSAGNICANTAGVVSHPTCIFYPHCVPGLNLVCTVLSSMGASYGWMRTVFAQAETELARVSGDDPYVIMNQEAAQSRPGAGGVIFLPYLEGDYTPNHDANARGVFLGMGIGTTRGDMLRAVLEGTAMAVWSNIQLIESLGGARLMEIIATGGPTRSRLWMQIMADVTGCSISLPEESEGAPFGNAIIAGVGAGVFRDFAEAVDRMVKIRRSVFVPNAANRELYRDIYVVYAGLYDQFSGTFESLARIRAKDAGSVKEVLL